VRVAGVSGLVVALAAAAFVTFAGRGAAHGGIVGWQPLSPGADAASVRFDPAVGSGAEISPAKAIAVATERVGAHATAPGVTTRVAFGRFSDDAYGDTLPDGTFAYKVRDRLAFVVTFSGTEVQPRGRVSGVNTEVNVAVDALTGEVLEVFSYR
jgi:hypothetical protein